ncbi:MAG: Hsp33 family molecular chaperone HslO [Clostridiales bacterium]|nr:Hsp33 family molecular chaperone HslO [Clostridiales bacterium]
MQNAIIAMDKSGSYRVYMAVTTDLVREACKIHEPTPTASAGLGRVLTAAGLMGIMLKGEKDKLTIQFKGDGPAQEILATGLANGVVKGYIANPDVDLPLNAQGKLDVGGSLGIGTLTVIKNLGLKEPYVGRIDLVNGEIAEDLTTYFFLSEQQNSAVILGVKVAEDTTVAAAAGVIIQMLPDAKEASIDALEAMLADMKPLSTLADENPDPKDLMNAIFGNMPEEYRPEVLEERSITWKCDCKMERLEQVMLTLGEEELTRILEEDGQAELTCHFCRSKYQFDRPHLEMLIRVAKRVQDYKDGKGL